VAARVQALLPAFSTFRRAPARVAQEARRLLDELQGLDPGRDSPQRQAWARATGSLEEINLFLSRIPVS